MGHFFGGGGGAQWVRFASPRSAPAAHAPHGLRCSHCSVPERVLSVRCPKVQWGSGARTLLPFATAPGQLSPAVPAGVQTLGNGGLGAGRAPDRVSAARLGTRVSGQTYPHGRGTRRASDGQTLGLCHQPPSSHIQTPPANRWPTAAVPADPGICRRRAKIEGRKATAGGPGGRSLHTGALSSQVTASLGAFGVGARGGGWAWGLGCTGDLWGRFRTARAQRGHSANYYRVTTLKTTCGIMHNQFKTQKCKHLMLAMGPRDLNSAPYSPVHCSSYSMTSFQSSELTELPVVENSQLFAQRTVRPL